MENQMTGYTKAKGSSRPGGGRQAGFTLIEIMIVLVILAILLMVVLPAYQDQVIRGHRSAAKSEMLEIANLQQQYLLANRAYATKAILEANSYTLPTDVASRYSYAVTLGVGAVPSYSMTFTAIGSQSGDGNLTITSEGVKTPADKWKR
jgi:type IV pilus assembly protein PilE